MKKITTLLLCASLLLMAGCSAKQAEEPMPSAEFVITTTQKPTEVFFDVTDFTDSAESSTAIQAIPRENTIDFSALRRLMQGVLFDEDNATAGRWTESLTYTIEGNYTQEDTVVISEIAKLLSQVQSFPGMREAPKDSARIHIIFGNFQTSGFTAERDNTGRIIKGEIQIADGKTQREKEALLTQNILHLCGLPGKTETSLSSALSNQPAGEITEADFLLLDILYGAIEPGDDGETCMEQFDLFFKN